MSKSLYVNFRDRGFWAFDVVSGVFLKHLIDVALGRLAHTNETWLSTAISKWRVNAVISDFGLYLDDDWSAEQIQTFTELATAACALLSKRIEIPAEKVESWQFINDLRRSMRGGPIIDTASVIRFGEAVIQLVNGSLPDPPPGTWWWFGAKDATRTMPIRDPR